MNPKFVANNTAIILFALAAGLLLGVGVLVMRTDETLDFNAYLLLVFGNAVIGSTIGSWSARRFHNHGRGVIFALACATITALLSGMIGKSPSPGATALTIGPVMAGMFYWSALISAHASGGTEVDDEARGDGGGEVGGEVHGEVRATQTGAD